MSVIFQITRNRCVNIYIYVIMQTYIFEYRQKNEDNK